MDDPLPQENTASITLHSATCALTAAYIVCAAILEET